MLLDLFVLYAVRLQMYYNYQVERFFVSNTAAEMDWRTQSKSYKEKSHFQLETEKGQDKV